MQVPIYENERIDDLQYKNLKIIQNKQGFCFGMDSVLLADFAKEIKPKSKVVDLGTGTGILGFLLCAKTDLSHITGIEIQETVAEMAARSILLNDLQNRFEVKVANVKQCPLILEKESFDAIVTNPPYKKWGTGIQNEETTKLIARHEVCANLEDFISASFQLLKENGSLYMVHRPDRMVDILSLLRTYRLEPKKLRLIYPYKDKQPNLLLIKATKYAGKNLVVEKPLIIYENKGKYTAEVDEIYGR